MERELNINDNHSFQMRCQAILLKAAGRTTGAYQIVGIIICVLRVDGYPLLLKRFKPLDTKDYKPTWRGGKPLLDKVTDKEAVLAAVKANWQSARQKACKRVHLPNVLKNLGRYAEASQYKRIRRRIKGMADPGGNHTYPLGGIGPARANDLFYDDDGVAPAVAYI